MKQNEDSDRQSDFYGICSQCRISCCKDARPPITPKRRRIIERRLLKNPLHGVGPSYFVKENGYTHPRETPDRFCTFYDKDTKLCRIHEIKPETCVAGPITFDVNANTKKLEYYLKMEKICPLAGRIGQAKDETLERHLQSAKREIRRLLADIEPESLRAVLKIEEPDTFKVFEEENKDAQRKLNSRRA